MILLIILAIVLLGIVFYPLRESPLSGGPAGANNPPHKLKKVSLYRYYELKKRISS